MKLEKKKKKKVYLGVEVATDGLLSPGLVIKFSSSLFFWVSYHICHGLFTGRRQKED